jgi:hypothetical protein
MKFSDLVQIQPSLVRPEAAAAILGSEELLDDMVAKGWLKPVVRRHKLTLYSVKALQACAARLEAGESAPV